MSEASAKPRLGLCVPVHNEAEMLPRLFEGIRAQSVPFDEIWVFDDASSDDTADVAESLGASVIRSRVNVGCSRAKDRLAERCQCDWLHFLDADDLHLPDFVERAHRWMQLPNPPDVVLFNYDYRDLATEELIAETRFPREQLHRDPLDFAIRHTICNIGLYQRERFLRAGGFDLDPAVLYHEDGALHIRLALAGLRFDREELPSIVMFRRPGSMSRSNRWKCFQSQFEVLKKTAAATGATHLPAIRDRLWEVVGLSAAEQDWQTADAAIKLLRELGGRWPTRGSKLFRWLCPLSPGCVVRLREQYIRRFRPGLRRTS